MEKDEIILRVMDIFSTYGVRAVSMDFIAQSIPLAKKDLLQIAKNKERLIELIFEYRYELAQKLYEKTNKETENAIDTLLKMSAYAYKNKNEFKPMLDFEFKKYYPELYNKYNKTCEQEFSESIEKNIIIGKEEGVYRTDLNPDITTHLYLEKIRMLHTQITNSELKWKPHKLFTEALINHIRGISTTQGIKYFEEKKHTIQHLLDD
jgi:AcrR family transcriptional regulator